MNYRIADTSIASRNIGRINQQRSRVDQYRQQIASGKRINLPSDDPSGAEAVLRIRTSQREIEQFRRSASAADQKLTAADDTLTNYQTLLERVRNLVTQGLSDTTNQNARNTIATELNSLRGRILNLANSRYGDEYLFGGTEQTVPPFNPTTGTPTSLTASPQYLQVEPGGAAIQVSVTARSVFNDLSSDIFSDLDTAITALRGTGDPVADRTALEQMNSRMTTYRDMVVNAHAIVGSNMSAANGALDNMANNYMSLEESAIEIESADFAETAVRMTEAQTVLDATLRLASQERRSLFDYL